MGCGAIGAGLTALGFGMLWTLCGAAIGVAVMFPAGLLGKRRAAKTPQPARQPA